MKTIDTFGQLDKLETMSAGDYSFTEAMYGKIAHMTVIKHNGGYFYCFADKYEYYREEITER